MAHCGSVDVSLAVEHIMICQFGFIDLIGVIMYAINCALFQSKLIYANVACARLQIYRQTVS